MSSSTKTTNLELSQFGNTDVPAWRSDYNGDMAKIDAAYAADISEATALESADSGDYMKIYDVSAAANKKIQVSNLLAGATDANAVHWSDQAIVGAHNLFRNTATTQAFDGITWTVNSDKSVTLSGTAASTTVLKLGSISVKAGIAYTLSSGSDNVNYRVDVRKSGNMWMDNTAGKEVSSPTWSSSGAYSIDTFTPSTDDTVDIYIRVANGTSILTPVTLYPMVRVATDTNTTYTEGVMTNRELTDKVTTSSSILTVPTISDMEWKYSGARANDIGIGLIGFVQLKRDATTGENAWITIGTTTKKPAWYPQIVTGKMAGSGTVAVSNVMITPSGDIQFNMKAGMKSGDQFSIAGTMIL